MTNSLFLYFHNYAVAAAAKAFGMQVWGMTRHHVNDDKKCQHIDKYM